MPTESRNGFFFWSNGQRAGATTGWSFRHYFFSAGAQQGCLTLNMAVDSALYHHFLNSRKLIFLEGLLRHSDQFSLHTFVIALGSGVESGSASPICFKQELKNKSFWCWHIESL